MSVKERLKKYLAYRKMSMRAFNKEIGASAAFISNMQNSIQPEKMDSISKHFPELSMPWLMTGEGEMIRNNNNVSENYQEQQSDAELIEIIRNQSETIRLQMESVLAKDRQIDELLTMLKKTDVRQVDNVECADVEKTQLAM